MFLIFKFLIFFIINLVLIIQSEIIKDMNIGNTWSCFLTKNNSVYCVGDDYYGTLGGTKMGCNPSMSPIKVNINSNIKRLYSNCRENTTVQLENGTLLSWGYNIVPKGPRQVIDETREVLNYISYYDQTSCYLLKLGYVYCKGSNQFHQLGKSIQDINYTSTWLQISNITDGFFLTHIQGRVFFASLNSGGVVSWGQEEFLGRTNFEIKVGLINQISNKVLDLACFHTHCAVIDANGDVYTWGQRISWALGDGSYANGSYPEYSLVVRATLFNQAALKIGGLYGSTCAYFIDQTVQCIGLVGGNPWMDVSILTPLLIPNGSIVTSFVNSVDRACILFMNHQAHCWGKDNHGSFGYGRIKDTNLISFKL